MDWKVLASTFWLIFLAELGDKTQLAAICMVGRTKQPVAVFCGAVLALALVTLVGVVAGEALTRVVPKEYITKAAAVGFIAVGVLMLFEVF